MRSEDIDWENPFEVWKYIMQPTVKRELNESDEHYKERLLRNTIWQSLSEEEKQQIKEILE